jgi:hypothetical protein
MMKASLIFLSTPADGKPSISLAPREETRRIAEHIIGDLRPQTSGKSLLHLDDVMEIA